MALDKKKLIEFSKSFWYHQVAAQLNFMSCSWLSYQRSPPTNIFNYSIICSLQEDSKHLPATNPIKMIQNHLNFFCLSLVIGDYIELFFENYELKDLKKYFVPIFLGSIKTISRVKRWSWFIKHLIVFSKFNTRVIKLFCTFSSKNSPGKLCAIAFI